MFKRNVFLNTGWKNMVREHREYYEFATGEIVGNNDVHHINEDKSDNRLSNLEKLSSTDHQRKHKMGQDNPHCKMDDASKNRRGKIHSAVMRCGDKDNTPEYIRNILDVRPPYRSNEQNETLWDWVCSLSNHKIVSIEDGGYTTVYDFSVPGRHNAVLSNGVVVHNCNLNVMFSMRPRDHPDLGTVTHSLDMTVTNRSNDLVWGMLGANYVHFTFLQEYMASRLGAEVGLYHHVTNNLHAYIDRDDWKPQVWLDWEDNADRRVYDYAERAESDATDYVPFHQVSMVKDDVVFDRELQDVVTHYDHTWNPDGLQALYSEPFLESVAKPMLSAMHAHKRGMHEEKAGWLNMIAAADWRIAATEWLQRRIKNER
jgi:hypothetical protein